MSVLTFVRPSARRSHGTRRSTWRPSRRSTSRASGRTSSSSPKIPDIDRKQVKADTVKGSQLLEPLFEFSGACAGCGETPYLKLLTQLYGDRLIVANATGCSSIYGGNLPTTPWAKNHEGRGPAWSNSLFEDNAEFGLGMRLAVNQQEDLARHLLGELTPQLGEDLAASILDAHQETEEEIHEQRRRVAQLKERLSTLESPGAKALLAVADTLVRRSVWIVGGDGWAYDIGFGGLDHVLASGRNVNVLVLDTEVYSNTGGQASKATPRAAVAKFAAQGKAIGKKDLGMIAVDYGNVYVAQVAMGANPLQTLHAFQEADSYTGPSLIIAYSHCIAHGIEMSTSMSHQKEAAASGYWPLYRYDPRLGGAGRHPFHLDSHKPTPPIQGLRHEGGPFRHADPVQSRTGRAAPAPGPARHRRALAFLRTDGGRRAHRSRPDGRGASMTVDLTTRYLGLELPNPLVISACSLTGKLDTLAPARGRRRRGGGHALVVRGADRA